MRCDSVDDMRLPQCEAENSRRADYADMHERHGKSKQQPCAAWQEFIDLDVSSCFVYSSIVDRVAPSPWMSSALHVGGSRPPVHNLKGSLDHETTALCTKTNCNDGQIVAC